MTRPFWPLNDDGTPCSPPRARDDDADTMKRALASCNACDAPAVPGHPAGYCEECAADAKDADRAQDESAAELDCFCKPGAPCACSDIAGQAELFDPEEA